MDAIARGEVKPRSPQSVMITKAAFQDLTAQFKVLQPHLPGFHLFVMESPSSAQAAPRAAKDASRKRHPRSSHTLPTDDTDRSKRATHTRIREVKFQAFLKQIEAELSALRRHARVGTTGAMRHCSRRSLKASRFWPVAIMLSNHYLVPFVTMTRSSCKDQPRATTCTLMECLLRQS